MAIDALRRKYYAAAANEPLWVDLRNLRQATSQGDADDVPLRLGDAVANFAAPRPRQGQLIGEHLRYVRQTRRLIVSIISALPALLLLVSVAALYASNQRVWPSRRRASHRHGCWQRIPGHCSALTWLCQLLAVEAYHGLTATTAALFTAVTWPVAGALPAYWRCCLGYRRLSQRPDSGRWDRDGQVRRWQVSGGSGAKIAQLHGAVSAVAASAAGTVIAAPPGRRRLSGHQGEVRSHFPYRMPSRRL